MSRDTFDPMFSAGVRDALAAAASAASVASARGARWSPRIPRARVVVGLVAAVAVIVVLALATPAMGEFSRYLRGFSNHGGGFAVTIAPTTTPMPTPATASATPFPTPTATHPAPAPSVSLEDSTTPQPGSAVVTALADPVSVTLSGTHTVELGKRPVGATGFIFTFRCLTPGHFDFGDDGSGESCSEADVAKEASPQPPSAPRDLAAGQHEFTITTDSDNRWELETTWVTSHYSDWGVNAKGETYGTGNPEKGEPDLIGVYATNGKLGYAYTAQLDSAGCGATTTPAESLACQKKNEGKVVSVPVYESDGETVVGEFVLGSGGGTVISPAPTDGG